MVARELKRVQLEPDTDLVRVLEAVHSDKAPRVIERQGRVLAVVVAPEDYEPTGTSRRSNQSKQELLSLAGAWRDLDADTMIDELYKARHEAPPSPSVTDDLSSGR
jgi:PHD/YefM family antitoxin component YafN of YafNO toxin-antitoxin module